MTVSIGSTPVYVNKRKFRCYSRQGERHKSVFRICILPPARLVGWRIMRFTSIALLLGISALSGAHADVSNFKPVAAINLKQNDETCSVSTVTKKETVTVTAGSSPTQGSKLPPNARIVTTPVVGSLTLGNADGEPVVIPVIQNRTLTVLEAPKTKSAKGTMTKTVTVTNDAECEATGSAVGSLSLIHISEPTRPY